MQRLMWKKLFLCLCAFFLPLGTVLAQPEKYSLDSGRTLERLVAGVEEVTLKNGVRILLYRRGSAPVFAGVVTLRVGSVDEQPGQTGIAHLLEHMAFKGTADVGTSNFKKEAPLLAAHEDLMRKQIRQGELTPEEQAKLATLQKQLEELWDGGAFDREYSKRGASDLNATTGVDVTNYFVKLPRSAFEFWCWLESERLIAPVLREFYKELDVVLEERRMRSEDSPSGKLYETLLGVAFTQHPYRNPIIGYESDLRSLTATDLEAFRRRFYVPSNITVAVVGDLVRARELPILERYFGRIPPGPPAPRVQQIEPLQQGERQVVVNRKSAPQILIAYHKPVFPHPDDAPLSLLAEILSQGRTSRLYQELIKKRRVVVSLDSFEAPGVAYPNLLVFGFKPRKPHTNQEVLQSFDAVLAGLQSKPVSAQELSIAKRKIMMSYLKELKSNLSLARDLARAQAEYGDWRALTRWYEQMLEVNLADVQRVAKQYLRPETRTVARLEQES